MSADPAPSAVEPEPIMCKCGHGIEDEHNGNGCCHTDLDQNRTVLDWCRCDLDVSEAYFSVIAALRAENGRLVAERDEAQRERDELRAENVRLTEFMKRAQGNLAAALIAPSAKVDS